MSHQELAKQQPGKAVKGEPVKTERLAPLDHQIDLHGPPPTPPTLSQTTLQRSLADPRALTPTDIQHLQSAIGNRAVQRLLNQPATQPTNQLSNASPPSAPIIQRSLKVGPAKDRFEEEADEVARQVIQRKSVIQRVSKNGKSLPQDTPLQRVAQKQAQSLPAHTITTTSTPRPVIQRTLAMDGSWSWLTFGWATGAKAIWDEIKPKFDLLPRLTAFLSEAKSNESYRGEDIVEVEKSVTDITRTYDKSISLDEGKLLQTALNKLPIGTSAETIPELAGAYLTKKKQAADKAKALKTEKELLQTYVDRLQELTKLSINFNVEKLDTEKRRNLVAELKELIATSTELLSEGSKSTYSSDVSKLETSYKEAAGRTELGRKEKEKRAQEEQAKLEKAAQLKRENQDKLGAQYGSMQIYAGGDVELAAILAAVQSPGEYAQLVNCRSVDDPKQLLLLLAKARPSELAKLLQAIGKGNDDKLLPLLEVVNKGESDDLAALIRRTKSNKSVLKDLLVRLKGSARDALTLLKLAGDQKEAELLSLMSSSISVRDAQILLSTTSGSGNAPDIETLVKAGQMDTGSAKKLLDTQGLRGGASDAIDLLGHEEVDNDFDKAAELLSKKGSATDIMWILQAKEDPDPLITLDELEEIIDADKFVRDQGEDAAKVLKSEGATVTRFVELLEWRTPSQIWSYIDKTKGSHKFTFVYNKLVTDNTQTFWTTEVCGEPGFSGAAANINEIIATAVSPPAIGRYAGGNGFGNYGGIDSDGQMNMLLPGDNSQNEVAYREYDLREHDGSNRGTRRMVVGNGKKFYTSDHYGTFAKFAG